MQRRRGQPGRTISLLLVEEQASVRQGLRMRLALESDLRVAGEAHCGESAVLMARRLRPSVVLIDIQMMCEDGLAAAEHFCRELPGMAVVVLAHCDDAPTRARARLLGARAFVSKQEGDGALLRAIREVAR